MDRDILVASDQILDAATQRGIPLRFLGGAAIRLRCPSALSQPLGRDVPDIDMISLRKHGRHISDMLVEMGVEPMRMFNALHGDRRLLFKDTQHGRQIDVFLGIFEMCHKFDFRKRLLLDEKTLPLADLLVTKLQIVEINEKDYKDILCLLLDHPLAETDGKETINAAHIAALCSDDWGIYRTLTRNLDWTREFMKGLDIDPPKKELLLGRIDALLDRIEKEPKSLRWKMRAKIGDRMIWYDMPERVGTIPTG